MTKLNTFRLRTLYSFGTVPSTVCVPLESGGKTDIASGTGNSLVHVCTKWYGGWIYMYICKTVPSTVCETQICSNDQRMSEKKVPLSFDFKGILFFDQTNQCQTQR